MMWMQVTSRVQSALARPKGVVFARRTAAPPHRRTAAPPHRRTAAPPHRRVDRAARRGGRPAHFQGVDPHEVVELGFHAVGDPQQQLSHTLCQTTKSASESRIERPRTRAVRQSGQPSQVAPRAPLALVNHCNTLN